MARAAGLSDVGRCRRTNQDHYLVDDGLDVCAVADGMGGHAAGEVASGLAIEALEQSLRASRPKQGGWSADGAAESLRDALGEANRRIVESMRSRAEWRGMGTTIVALLAVDDVAVIGHVGDSRAYLLREGRLRLLTSDHSYVNEQVRLGLISSAEAQRHPMRNIVTRALGNMPEVDVELTREPLRPGDVFALCSDGLNGMLSDEQIESTLVEHRDSPGDACRALVDQANANGGEDNVTVVVLEADSAANP